MMETTLGWNEPWANSTDHVARLTIDYRSTPSDHNQTQMLSMHIFSQLSQWGKQSWKRWTFPCGLSYYSSYSVASILRSNPYSITQHFLLTLSAPGFLVPLHPLMTIWHQWEDSSFNCKIASNFWKANKCLTHYHFCHFELCALRYLTPAVMLYLWGRSTRRMTVSWYGQESTHVAVSKWMNLFSLVVSW